MEHHHLTNQDDSGSDGRGIMAGALVEILGGAISLGRACELLEANNGSMERAVELHFAWAATQKDPWQSPTNLSDKIQDTLPKNLGTQENQGRKNLCRDENASSPTARNVDQNERNADEEVVCVKVIRKDSTKNLTPISKADQKIRTEPTTRAAAAAAAAAEVQKSPPSTKRRRLQSTLDVFVLGKPESPACKKTCSIDQKSRESKRMAEENASSISPDESQLKTPHAVDEIPTTDSPVHTNPEKIISVEVDDIKVPVSSPDHGTRNQREDGQSAVVSTLQNFKDAQSSSMAVSSLISYSSIVQTLVQVTSTTKRTLKLEALQTMFNQLLTTLSLPEAQESRVEYRAHLLHMTMDLVLGKITTTSSTIAAMSITSKAVLNNTSNALPRGPTGKSQDTATTTSLTLQVSGAAVSKALQIVLGISPTQMRQVYRKLGDLGDVAAQALDKKTSVQAFFVVSKPKTTATSLLSVAQIHEFLQALVQVPTGKGSATMRHELLVKLFRGASQEPNNKDTIRFLVRTVLGNMRLGATLKTVLAALAMAVESRRVVTTSSVREFQKTETAPTPAVSLGDRMQKVYNVCPRLNDICLALIQGGSIEYAEEHCSLALGYPVEPMLANPAQSLDQVEQFLRKSNGSAAVAEWKYDGVRCQAHYKGNAVTLFSRHLLDQTRQYPDAASYFLEAAVFMTRKNGIEVESFICDAEIAAIQLLPDPTTKGSMGTSFRLLPFQDLRRSAGNANNGGRVRVYCFDLLYLNGRSLLKTPLRKRQELLRYHFAETEGFTFAQSIPLPPLRDSTVPFDQQLVANALSDAVQGGAEGLMVKLTGQYFTHCKKGEWIAQGFYEAGTRSHEWLKVKRDYVGGSFADTIDVVPIGAWYGNGRKAKAGYLSPVLLAVYDEDEGCFRSISRCMSFSDSMYQSMRNFYLDGVPYDDNNQGAASANLACSGPLSKSAEESVEDDDAGSGDSECDQAKSGSGDNDDGCDLEFEGAEKMIRSVTPNKPTSGVNCFPGRPPATVIVTNENPPIWFQPLEVFEVSFADLSLSRAHTAAAGLVDDAEGRGVALRFPRFKRRRPDKGPEQATTTAQIAHMFYQQSKMLHHQVPT